jgi:hypothetical protein
MDVSMELRAWGAVEKQQVLFGEEGEDILDSCLQFRVQDIAFV